MQAWVQEAGVQNALLLVSVGTRNKELAVVDRRRDQRGSIKQIAGLSYHNCLRSPAVMSCASVPGYRDTRHLSRSSQQCEAHTEKPRHL